jgi:putative ABC transport system permease protein
MTSVVSVRRTPWARLFALAWRESRTARRRLLLYMSSISLGVAALVAIDSFAENVTRSVHEQSRALLGGDVSINSNEAFTRSTTAFFDSLQHTGNAIVQSVTFSSMALVPRSGGTRLVQVRAIDRGYPFYGNIVTDPLPAWGQLHTGAYTIVDPSLLLSLGAAIGDTMSLGTGRFVILGTLKQVPGDLGISAAIGPRVYISQQFLAQTGLLVFGSRAQREALVKLAPNVTQQDFVNRFRKRLRDERVNMRTVAENEYNLTQAIDQLRDFLSVVGLVALLLGGIGVASGVHAFVMRKIDTVAVLRCLGATSWQVLLIYVVQAAAMGLVGALAGALLGIALQFALPSVVGELLPVDVTVHLAPPAVALGLLIGVWVALVFSMRPLVALRRVSPLQALRREADTDALRSTLRDPLRMAVTVAIVASVVFLGTSRADRLSRGIGYSVAIGLSVLVLWVCAVVLSGLAKRSVRPRWPFVVRQGIASLYRPGNQTRAVVLALGFGVFLMSTLYQVQNNLLRTLDLKLEQARANVVFFDIQDAQAREVDSIVRAQGQTVIQRAPIVPMKLASINGRQISDIASDTGRRRRPGWALRREYRSTYRESMASSEKIVAGRWFTERKGNDTLPQISVENELGRELRLSLGDTVTWNVQGVRVPTVVTSFREVTWARFEPNFFIVFEPRALERAPKQWVYLAHVPQGSVAVAQLQRAVVSRLPTVSSLDLTLIQRTVTSVLEKVTTAIRFLAMISLTLGVPVLFSAVSATRRERLREGVLLKTLGATRRQIGRIMLAEYALLGVLGSMVGVVLSIGSAWALMHWIFRTPFVPSLLPAVIVAGAMTAVAVAIGLLTGREVFAQTPMAALREA